MESWSDRWSSPFVQASVQINSKTDSLLGTLLENLGVSNQGLLTDGAFKHLLCCTFSCLGFEKTKTQSMIKCFKKCNINFDNYYKHFKKALGHEKNYEVLENPWKTVVLGTLLYKTSPCSIWLFSLLKRLPREICRSSSSKSLMSN